VKQHEAVIQIMLANGGFATLGYLYQHVMDIEECRWNTKTPFASIRRIVQDDRFFYKIKPGLWALKEMKNKLPGHLREDDASVYGHTYYQGLSVEIGNFRNLNTYVPKQDSKKEYLNQTLSESTTIDDVYKFTYDNLIKFARTVDVIWFNERNMPNSFIEIEHTTQFKNSLLKFVELQDFHSNFIIISDDCRRSHFHQIINEYSFKDIAKRVKFISYKNVANLHQKSSELAAIKKEVNF
jgi:hypothetical protein